MRDGETGFDRDQVQAQLGTIEDAVDEVTSMMRVALNYGEMTLVLSYAWTLEALCATRRTLEALAATRHLLRDRIEAGDARR